MTHPALHDVIDGLEVFICGLDDDGTIRLFNRPCERLTGLPRNEALGKSWLDLFAIGHRHDLVTSLWGQTRTGAPAGPYEALCRNGRSLRWQFSRWEPGPTPPVALWAVGIDVTHEREALIRARQLERTAALCNLVSGLTHELRNPLNGALLQLALADRILARRSEAAPIPAVQAIAHATAEVRRISAVLDDFMVFVRPVEVHLERVDVRHVVGRAIERAAARASAAGVSIVLEPGDHAPAEIDVSRVESAVYQLLANAIDAAATSDDPEIRARLVFRSNTTTIEIEDHGGGLPSGDTPVFEPFFTTKTGGTGLGLAIVQRVAVDHGGAIGYERRDGATVFRLELPIIGGVAN